MSGAKIGWWKDLEKVEVGLIPEKEGWFLTKYRVESDVSCDVTALGLVGDGGIVDTEWAFNVLETPGWTCQSKIYGFRMAA